MGTDKGSGWGQGPPESRNPLPAAVPYNETEAKRFLNYYEQTANTVLKEFVEATWNYVTNITKPNREEMVWFHLPAAYSFCPSSSQGLLGIRTPRADPCLESEERGKLRSTC